MRARALAIVLIVASVAACKRDKDGAAARRDPDEKKVPSPAALVIRKKPPVVGMRVRETKQFDLTFDFAVAGTKHSSVRKQSDTRLEEVLEVDGKRVTRLRVTYEARGDTETVGGTSTTRPSPVVGKTYVVEVKDPGVRIVDAAGKWPPADEEAIVENDYASLSSDAAIADGIPDTPLRPGDAVPTLANAFKNRVLGKKTVDVQTDIDVKVDGPVRTGSEVAFAVKMTFNVGSGPVSLTMPIKGTVTVRVGDGWISDFALNGVVTMSGADGGPLLEGDGKMTMSAKRTYL